MPPLQTTIALIFLLSLHCAAAGTNEPIRWLFNPTPRSEMSPMTTDRFGMTLSPLTIDPGHVQLETDILNYNTFTRHTLVRSFAKIRYEDSYYEFLWSPKLRVGLANGLEAQISVTYRYSTLEENIDVRYPFEWPPIFVSGEGVRTTYSSWFPSYSPALKIRLMGDEDSCFAAAFVPFLILPAQSKFEVSGGAHLPMALRLPDRWEVRIMPAFVCMDDRASGMAPAPGVPGWYYAAPAYWFYGGPFLYANGSIDVSKQVTDKMTFFTGFMASVFVDAPDYWSGAVGVGGAYQLFRNVQLDFGNRFGVTETSMDYNPFLGISVRF